MGNDMYFYGLTGTEAGEHKSMVKILKLCVASKVTIPKEVKDYFGMFDCQAKDLIGDCNDDIMKHDEVDIQELNRHVDLESPKSQDLSDVFKYSKEHSYPDRVWKARVKDIPAGVEYIKVVLRD